MMLKLRLKEQLPYVCIVLIVCVFLWITSVSSLLKNEADSETLKILAKKQRLPKLPISNRHIMNAILQDCGLLCDTSRKGISGPFFDHVTAPINCKALFENDNIDRGHGLPKAPKDIPDHLLNAFTMNGRIRLKKRYFNEQFLGRTNAKPIWTISSINKMIALAKKGQLHGTYGVKDTNSLRNGLQHSPGIQNGRVLVIGSRNPWVEACVLEAGAKEIVTLEYGEIISKHPKLKTMVPLEFRKSFLNGSLGVFDGVVTFSSIEHSGLGRFGDMLNPWGDIITIARAWCVTRKAGFLTIGVSYNFDNEYISFNSDRGYGKIRYPYLTTNWNQHYRGWGVQRVHVFTK